MVVSDDRDEEIEALRDRLDSLEDKYEDLEMRYQAVVAKNDALREIMLGDLQTTYDDVREAPSLWEQIADLRSDSTATKEKVRRLDSAGARGQPGAARKVKIRHALVKKATQNGTNIQASAGQQGSPAMDYEDILALFDYEISKSYASKLLDKAADNSTAFWVRKPNNPRDGRKALHVDTSELDSDSPYLREARRDTNADSTNADFVELGNNEHSEGGGSE